MDEVERGLNVLFWAFIVVAVMKLVELDLTIYIYFSGS